MFRICSILIGLLLLLPISVVGQTCTTIIPGGTEVYDTWTPAGSPYCITGDVQVSMLTIEPDVIVEFAGNFGITVNGILKIVGTQEYPVLLKPAADNTEGWKGIYFEDTMTGSEFEWCRFEGARSSAVHLVNSNPPFRHCTFADNRGSYGGGIRAELNDGDLIIENCRFFKNYADVSGGAIYAMLETGTLMVNDCSFRENKANPDYAGRDASGGAVLVSGNSNFLRCAFYYNQAHAYTIYTSSGRYTRGGALWSQDGQCNIIASDFKNNACSMTAHSQTPDWSYPFGGAIFLYSGSMILENCLLAKNSLSAQRNKIYRGSALYTNTGECKFVNCTLVENTSAAAIYNDTAILELINSIVFFNNNSGTQISGTAVVSYSDIQGGFEGIGIIGLNPILDSEYRILPPSPAIDKGNPSIEYQDTIPPGLGTETNDMGFLGGPNAHQWEGQSDLTGACCLPYGSCLHLPQSQCVNDEGGSFQEIGTDCAFVECPVLNQPPLANAGVDKMVFDQITLDGTLSNDPDGTIVSYEWQLIHRGDPNANRVSEGESPTVTNLTPGFYDVTLIVTDNGGIIASDEMLFTAIGKKGDFDLDGDVDGVDLSEFAQYFGL